jgi:hypothetical protein
MYILLYDLKRKPQCNRIITIITTEHLHKYSGNIHDRLTTLIFDICPYYRNYVLHNQPTPHTTSHHIQHQIRHQTSKANTMKVPEKQMSPKY